MRLTRRSVNLGVAASLAAPVFSRVARAADDTIKVGMVLPVTGPAADVGGYALAGAKIALDRVNKSGGVLGKTGRTRHRGRPDDQSGRGARLLQARRAAGHCRLPRSIRSTQNHAMAADVLKTGKPVCFGGTDPALTKMGNPWLIRFRPNDTYSGRVIASYGVETLGKKNWAIVHSTDAFGMGGFKACVRRDRQTRRQDRDRSRLSQPEPGFHAGRARDQILRRRRHRLLFHLLKRSGDFRSAVATARRHDPLGRIANDRRPPRTVKLAGPALWGTYAVADYAIDSSPEAKEFAKLYSAVSNAPPDL